MISDTIKLLQMHDFYNSGQTVEIAKGKNELALDWKTARKKMKRLWRLRKN